MSARRCVLLKYGELVLKGRNRGFFEQRLLDNIQHVFADWQESVRITRRDGVLVLSARVAQSELVDRARRLIGINRVQPALRATKDPEAAATAAIELLREQHGASDGSGNVTFAIRARRRDKNFAMNSEQLAAYIGRRVQEEFAWSVDLGDPDVEVIVEVDHAEIFVSTEQHQGQGGLPVGTSGRALVLLSGGYDSPVAAYRAMRRGLRCDFVHFTGAPFTGPSSTYKAYALVRELDRFQGDSRLHTIPIGKAQRALATSGAGQLQIVAQRRLIVRVAEALAGKLGSEALVTGDSLGQVSSQTLSNLTTTEQACALPLLRPLLAWDKEEIIAEARRIGTSEISKLPDEDCCKLIMPPRVATRTMDGQLDRVESRAGIDDLVDAVLTNVQVVSPHEQVPAS